MKDGPDRLLEDVLAARARAEDESQAGAWIALVAEEDLRMRVEELLERTAAAPRPPLFGMTFAVKDNIDVAGMPTTAGCPDFGRVAARSATAVERLLDAGAVLIGKTNLDQFATGLVGTRSPYGTPRNTLDPRLVPGGSSSGSAVAVAGGAVDFALGTDTAGSGRVPAAMNGIVGLKPTRGLVSTRGVVPACRTLDCVSVFTRDLGLARRVLDAIVAPDAEDAFSRGWPREAGDAPWSRSSAGATGDVPGSGASTHVDRTPRIGVPDLPLAAFDGDAEAQAAFAAATATLAAAGLEPVRIDAAPLLRAGELLYDGPWIAERAAAVGAFVRDHPDAVLPVTRELILGGFEPSAVESFRALYELEELRATTRRLYEEMDLDAIALPTIPTPVTLAEDAAEPIARNALLGRFTHAANLLDLAALALPGPPRADGGPASLMLLGPAFSDRRLLTLGARLVGEPAPTTLPSDEAPSPPASGGSVTSVPSTAPGLVPADVELLVVGAHMRGMPLEPQLRGLGGRPLGPARTDAGYRMVALDRLEPPRPGLVPDPDGPGNLSGELWALPAEGIGTLLTMLVEPLSLGPVRLAGGREVVGFICSPGAVLDSPDITAFGGWREYLAAAV